MGYIGVQAKPNLEEPILIRLRLTNSIEEVREPILWQTTILYTTSFDIVRTALFSAVNFVGDYSDSNSPVLFCGSTWTVSAYCALEETLVYRSTRTKTHTPLYYTGFSRYESLQSGRPHLQQHKGSPLEISDPQRLERPAKEPMHSSTWQWQSSI
jgi:hypothetical protein